MELQHARCCGIDVHKNSVVVCLRLVSDGKITTEVRTFGTTTAELFRLSEPRRERRQQRKLCANH
jgi:hypothetical protein